MRIRDNQRRSRARRKDLIKDLQTRVQEFELKGVAATQDMQRAARKVAQENERLRTLLARHGILKEEIESFLLSCETTGRPIESEPQVMGARSSGAQYLYPNNPGPRLIHTNSLSPACPQEYSPHASPVQLSRRTAQIARQESEQSIRPSGPMTRCGTATQCGSYTNISTRAEVEATIMSRPVEACRQAESYYASPSETDSSPPPSRPQENRSEPTYAEHAPSITQSQACCPPPGPPLEVGMDDAGCPSTADCFCPPMISVSLPTHKVNQGNDEISCETAATIIAQMRGDGDDAAARASIGCGPGQVCSIKNSFLMQIMDER
ncbi:hypothetical protein C7974DRAFT_89028 [Boeremia exigua]|uniref:uncharacterized protein n=1 Tax=Boeremia exigua TaxID=749465 RepID=UPI001E8E82E7|nr:uncharacterized protein C7974DRAFT_89028 [Boeremia exigua]KAH6611992.1 hypothetical protein C7974DRAFT_89028 [Boeremia exigua]